MIRMNKKQLMNPAKPAGQSSSFRNPTLPFPIFPPLLLLLLHYHLVLIITSEDEEAIGEDDDVAEED